MESQQSWEFSLDQFIEKDHENAPDFIGEAHIGTSLYDVAAWFGEISKGKNQGRPYLGLQLTSKGNATQKVSISLWEKANRKTTADPHFKTREQLNGQELKFAAWIQPVGEIYRLRIVIEPFSAKAGDLSEAAMETHTRLSLFVQEAQLRLPGGERPELPPGKSVTPEVGSLSNKRSREETDPDPDVEPDDIPF
jgi:hypothetical protein